jgi:hypothetical protein
MSTIGLKQCQNLRRLLHAEAVCRFCVSSFRKKHVDARKSFGSFHSEDIEVLVRQHPNDFTVPEIFHDIHEKTVGNLIDLSIQRPIEFGRDARRLYHIDEDWTFINHGAFGGALVTLLQQASLWRDYCERQPLRFFDRDLFPLIANTLRVVATGIFHCPPEELLPLPNVTTGLNAIFKSIPIEKEDEIIHLSLTYGSTKKMMKDVAIRTGARVKNISLPLPVQSNESIINSILQHITDKSKLIVLDHITSNTALELPVVEIAQRCKQLNQNIIVVVDGAHSMFSQNVSIYPTQSKTDEPSSSSISSFVDFWLTNGHKWFCAPKGCAFMWVSPKVSTLRPAIISHGFQPDDINPVYCAKGKFLSSFAWDGCRDYAGFITAASGVALWNHLVFKTKDGKISTSSWDKYRNYSRMTLNECESLFQYLWRIQECEFPGPLELRQNAPMRLIPLPRLLRGVDTTKTNDKDAFLLQVSLILLNFHCCTDCGNNFYFFKGDFTS